MRVFKATGADMACTMGRGRYQYELGVPATAKNSKCAKEGLHACEYVLDCTDYYGIGNGSRFFEAEAEGDIAEDGMDTRIACTKLTLVRELGRLDIAVEAMRYMRDHPKRDGWEKYGRCLQVRRDSAEAEQSGGIAIARGKDPRVRGSAGSYLGLVREKDGAITEMWIAQAGKAIEPDRWYTIEQAKRAALQKKRKEKED